MRSLRSLTALSGVLAIGTAISAAPAAAKSNEAACADTIFHGGSIITMQGDTPETVEALAVSGATILAQGDLQDLAANQCEDTQDRDLAGKTLLPGFIDAHGHVSAVGQLAVMANLSAPPVGDATSIEAIQDRLRAYIADNALPAGTIVMGYGYDDSQLASGQHPTRDDLDAVSTEHPILILHASMHLGATNSAMLEKSGITAESADPAGGTIRRLEDGKTPNGVLEETAFFRLLGSFTNPSGERTLASIIAGQKIYAKYGITTAQDGGMAPAAFQSLQAVEDKSGLLMDTVVLIAAAEGVPDFTAPTARKGYSDRVRVAGIKLMLDGSPQGRTAWLKDPVPVPPAGQGHDYHGYPAMKPGVLEERLAKAAVEGIQVYAHVNGDAAAQALIDGVRETGLAGKRTIAIHNQVVSEEQLAEQAELDIQPNFFANHTYFWGDWHREVSLGAERADRISPQAGAWAAGLTPTAHNDSPVVPPDVMRLVWSSVNRRTISGDILGPAERVSTYRALQQVTINVAWQIHEDDRKGSLQPGKLANLVILDRNPLETPDGELADIEIVETLVEGQTIYSQVSE